MNTKLFVTMFEISVATSVMLGVLLLISPMLNRIYAIRWKYWLWLVLAVRMVIPFSPSFAGIQIQVELADNPVFVSPAPVVPLPEPMAGAVVQNTEPMVISRLAALTAIWAAGVLLFLLYHGVGYQICKRRYLRWSRPVQDETTKRCLEQAKSQVGVHACCVLYSGKHVYGPLTIGFFKPYLLLPEAVYAPQDLAYIFKHELVHIKRRDVWYKLMLLVANAVHWFNPLAYLMVRKASEDLELLCDDAVVQGFTYQQRKAYSKVILEAAYNQCRPATQLSTTFKGSVKTLKERIANLLGRKPKKQGMAAYGILLLSALLIGGFLVCIPAGAASVIQLEGQTVQIENGVRGIDVSAYQEDIDWEAVANDQVHFVMLRASYRLETDNKFKENAAEAHKQGLQVGAYHYGSFTDEQSMLEEAAHFLALIQDVDITCPVVLDMEQTQDGLTRERRTALCVAFLELLEQNGYDAMLYSYAGYFDNYLDAQQFEQFGLWVANYREEPDFGQRLWQYTSAGRVNGIDGIVDINVSYGDLNRNKAG